MEGSNNQTQQSQATAPKAAQAAPQQQQPAKSYTERFVDMEQTIAKIAYVVNFHTNALTELMQKMDAIVADLESLNMVRQSVNAMMELSKEGLTLSMDNVAKKVSELQKEATKKQLAEDLASGKLLQSEKVEDDNAVIEFSSLPEDDYGIVSVSILKSELKSSLLGRRAGDVVDGLTILGVYKQNPEYKAEGTASEEAANQKQ